MGFLLSLLTGFLTPPAAFNCIRYKKSSQSVIEKKVPVLGDIPLLNILFTNKAKEENKRNIAFQQDFLVLSYRKDLFSPVLISVKKDKPCDKTISSTAL
jgi:hypothetical protein